MDIDQILSRVKRTPVPTHCPVCGGPLDIIQQEFRYEHIHRVFNNYTCWNQCCAVFGRTCSDRDIDDQHTLSLWKAVQRFDVVTGKELEGVRS